MRLNSIRTRTAIVLLSTGILIVLVLGGLWVYTTYVSMSSEIRQSNLQDARLVSGYVDAFTQKIVSSADVAAGSPDVVDAIRGNNIERLRLAGDNLASVIRESDVVVILDNESNVLYHSKGASTTGFVTAGWYDEALKKNDTYITGLYYSYSLNDLVFGIVVPVQDRGSSIGYIITSVQPEKLDQELQRQRISPDRNIIVVDDRGLVISHDNGTYVEKNADFSFALPVQELMVGREGVMETSQTFDGRQRIVGHSPVPGSGWGAIVTTPMSVVYSQILRRVIEILALISGMSILIIALGYFVSRYLTDPIVRLSSTMREISTGNLRARANVAREDEIGDLARTFNTMMDGLERTAKLERVMELTKKYHLIFRRAKDPIFFIDVAGRMLDANKAASDVYGYSRDELLSMNVADFRVPEGRPKIHDALEQCFEQGCVYETVHVRKDGSAFPVEISAAGASIGNRPVIVAVIRDITERKRAQEALAEAKEHAELYVDIMAHDINNLNQVALINLELLELNENLTEEERRTVDAVLGSIYGSVNIIENVRRIQKITSEELYPEPEDLDAMISKCMDEAPKAPDKKVSFRYTPRKGLTVRGAPLLKEAFCNLINNSIKYSGPEVDIDIEIDEVALDGKRYYQTSIADNGFGIPDEVKPMLFQRFQRGTTKAHGKGLGLYIVKMLVERFDGRVRVEDRVPGDHKKGARFIVLLPVAL